MTLRRWWFALAILVAAPAVAQEVRIGGDDRTRAAQIAREVLQRGNYLRIERDTVLPESFHATGDLVVVDADVRLAGRVDGSAVVLGGHLFLRPTAVVGGQIAVVGGGVYPSGRATYGTVFESNPSTRVTISASGDTTFLATLDAPPGRPFFSFGPMLPTYDRVNGVTLSGGATVALTPEERGTTVGGWVSFRHRNDDHLGGGVRVDVPVSQGVRLQAEVSRATRTNDAWARPDITNSISALTVGLDYRDYYDADRARLFVARPRMGRPLIAGESWLGPRLGVQVEEARSLSSQRPWSLWGELDRPNPGIADGRITSLIAGTELHWVGRLSRVSLDAQVERGHLADAVPALDPDFTQVTAHGLYTAVAFRTHVVRYGGRVMLPLGSGAPPQREAILGGVPTIPTLPIAAMRGDHLVFTAGSYGVPLPRMAVPFLGIPTIEAHHAVGAAWRGESSPEWVQNIGLGVQFMLFGVRVAVDPEDVESPRFWFTVSGLTR